MSAPLLDVDLEELLRRELECEGNECTNRATHLLRAHGKKCRDGGHPQPVACALCVAAGVAHFRVVLKTHDWECQWCKEVFDDAIEFLNPWPL